MLRAIQSVQSEIANRPEEFLEEEDTKDYLIKPILNALGWQGLERLRNQYLLQNGKRVDMALLQQGNPVVLVEAKALRKRLDDQALEQIIGYCFRSTAKTALLTNGVEWRVYRPRLEKLDFEQRSLFHVRLDEADAEKSARELSQLHYDKLHELEKRDPNILLNAYWEETARKEILEPFSDTLREKLIKWSEKPPGEVPSRAVSAWLRAKLFPGRRPRASRGSFEQKQRNTKKPKVKVSEIVIAGEHIPAKHGYEVLIHTAEWLVREGKLHRDVCPIIVGDGDLYLIHREPVQPNGDDFRGAKKLSNGLFVTTNFGTRPLIGKCRDLLVQFGYSPDILRVIEQVD
ncbi:MAG: type I restriction enzyme HsdR N-terminal domain-containing protein [Anaerolineaceae bacterium]|nr:type I restriction enzyme HsdR N-terminal domain-containing protein [Anaerolineaceae bacterium]